MVPGDRTMSMGGGDGMGMEMSPPPSSSSSGGGMHMKMGGGGMHMTFFWGTHVQVLFTGWPGDRGGGMYALALLCVFAAAAAAESLSALSRRISDRRPTSTDGIALTAVHAARMVLAYMVMLATMSFNVGIFIAAVAGHAVGFLLFSSGIFTRARAGYVGSHVDDALPSASTK